MSSRHILGAVFVLLLSCPCVLPAQTATSSATVDDGTLKSRVEANIHNQTALKNQDIDVTVENHVVTLSGTVQSAARKERAEHAAHVRGVTSVVNNLKVDANGGKNIAEKTGGAVKTAGSKTGEAAKTVGEKTKEGASATGEAVTDAWINTKVHANMMNEPLLHRSDINVDVNDHVVTLKGTVETAAGKARAEQIAKSTDGVKAVINNLAIGSKK
jgi:hyperosmotically inducible periplasmic protein